MKAKARQAESSFRSLKIEEAGDPYIGGIKPKIRLAGNWLRDAGFDPGGRVRVSIIRRGVITMTTLEALSESCSQIPPEIGDEITPVSKDKNTGEKPVEIQLFCEQGETA